MQEAFAAMIRAVIYCRCSTDEESQQEALKKQVIEAKASVEAKGWLLVDEYIESKSGTTADKRKEYQRLFEDLQSHKFDIVQIKSQDRLMRNTKDWYLFVDRLATNGKKLYMYLEQKFYTPDDALITGIKAILAEEYSKELSKKINNAHKNRQRQGESFILPPGTYGYQKQQDKSIAIVEEEAKVIRLMFHLCRTMGCGRIASVLENEGHRDRRGRIFHEETIRKIIRNPIRCGTVVQNRRHFDFQLKQELKMPEEEWIVHKEAIPAIVSEEVWREANAAMDKRADRYQVKNDLREKREQKEEQKEKQKEEQKEGQRERQKEECAGTGGGRFVLSGKIHCGLCGANYYRTSRKSVKNHVKIIEWKCSNYLRYGRADPRKARPQIRRAPKIEGKGCDNIHLDEQKLLHLLEEVCETHFGSYGIDYGETVEKLLLILKKTLNTNPQIEERRGLACRIQRQELLNQRLVDKLLEGVISDSDYRKKRVEFDEILNHLRKKSEICKGAEEMQEEAQNRIRKIEQRLKEDILHKTVLSEMLGDIKEIEVFEDRLKIQFHVKQVSLEFPLGKEFVYASQKKVQRDRIIAYMKENPSINARKIAGIEDISLAAANYRIKKLRQQKKIYFKGRGGHGKWVICGGEGKE